MATQSMSSGCRRDRINRTRRNDLPLFRHVDFHSVAEELRKIELLKIRIGKRTACARDAICDTGARSKRVHTRAAHISADVHRDLRWFRRGLLRSPTLIVYEELHRHCSLGRREDGRVTSAVLRQGIAEDERDDNAGCDPPAEIFSIVHAY